MSLVKGRFALTWGGNTLEDIEAIDINYEQKSDDFETVQHSTYVVDGPIKASITLTLLKSDIASLAAVLPQNVVAQGEDLSTGETVDSSVGAIEMIADCGDSTHDDLEIVSCEDPGQVLRLVNCRTKLESIDNTAIIRTVKVQFIGEAGDGVAAIQFFESGGIS